MTDPLAFALAVLALLAVPGPTNTLLAASGAASGFRHSLRLIPAEIGGYTISISLLIALFGPVAGTHPAVIIVIRLLASAYLIWSAVTLWRRADRAIGAAAGPIGFLRVFVTTLLNPKALIFAFVIFPPATTSGLAAFAAIFALLVVSVATGWITLGAGLTLSASKLATPARIARVAALALCVFAILIGGSAIAAVAG